MMGRERVELLRLDVLRNKLAKAKYNPFDTETVQGIVDRIKPLIDKELETIKRGEKSVTETIWSLRNQLSDAEEEQNPVALAGYYVLDKATTHFFDTALAAKKGDDPPAFMAFFDIDYGASLTVQLLLRGSLHILPDMSQSIAESATASENQFSINDQAEVFMAQQTISSRCRVLVEKDPRGFLLIEEAAKCLKGQPNEISEDPTLLVPTGSVPEFIAAGADFAEALYKAIYPVAEKLVTP